MAKQTKAGNLLYLEFAGVQIDADFRDFDPGLQEMTADATSGTDPLATSAKIREQVAPSFSLVVTGDATGLAIKAAVKMGATGNLIWGEDGNGAGSPKWGIEARLIVNIVSSHGDIQVMDVVAENIGRDWLFDGRTATF